MIDPGLRKTIMYHLGLGSAEAKRLRQLARGKRGTGRGKGVDSTDTPAAQSAEDEREAS